MLRADTSGCGDAAAGGRAAIDVTFSLALELSGELPPFSKS